MNRYRVFGFSLLSLAATLTACGGSGAKAGASVRDSAGITIVENTDPVWGASDAWVVVDSPTVQIGGDETNPLQDLAQASGALRLRDGRLVVVNGATSEIRFYAPSGGHLSTTGRKGQGPGEFQMPAGLWPVEGDSLLVFDALARRVTVIAPDGTTPRTYPLGGVTGAPIPVDGRVSMALPVGWFRDGGILGMEQTFRINDPRSEAYRDTVSYLRFGPDGLVKDTVARLPGLEMTPMALSFGGQTFNTPSPVPLGRNTVVAGRDSTVYLATNDAYQIEVRGLDGKVQRLIRMLSSPVPITAADQDAHRKETLEEFESGPTAGLVPGPMKEQINKHIAEAAYPSHFAPLVEMRFDADGFLWAQESPRPGTGIRTYAVFDTAGVFLGRVTMPKDFAPTWFGEKELVGIWQDADQVQYVRAYPLRKP
ncbi:MAG: hypothetical protein AABZ01_09125 [Gemmatimonadota bacterium]